MTNLSHHTTPITLVSKFPKSLGKVEVEASEYMENKNGDFADEIR